MQAPGIVALAAPVLEIFPIIGGVWLLTRKKPVKSAADLIRVTAAWTMISVGITAFIIDFGTAVGLAYGLSTLTIVGYSFVAMRFKFRQIARRSEPRAAEPDERPGTTRAAIAKLFLAVCAAGFAAIAFGVAFEAVAPLPEKDRIVIGGLLVPLLWAGGISWMMADPKFMRAGSALAAVAAVGYVMAFLLQVVIH